MITVKKKNNKNENIKKKKIKKNKKNIFSNLHIKSSFKNTLISLTHLNGNVFKQWSSKSLKKTKFKKNTPYNLQLITHKIYKYIQLKKINKLNIFFNGRGKGRFNILKNLRNKKIKIKYIIDKNNLPFNGCRQKKQKRR